MEIETPKKESTGCARNPSKMEYNFKGPISRYNKTEERISDFKQLRGLEEVALRLACIFNFFVLLMA
jgi:hypothetical protein